jgi:thiamine-phosphate pyrophosphorylase
MTILLPRLYLITDRHHMQPSFELALAAALEGGARLIQLREKDLSLRHLHALAESANFLCQPAGARLLINSSLDVANAVGAGGVHLPDGGPGPAAARELLSPGTLCGVSVHSTPAAQQAAAAGADYLIFGSIFQTSSHPGAAPAGLDALREVAASVACPVYAIGGIEPGSVADCLKAGAYGVAVRSAVWEAPDAAVAVRDLLAALG